MKHKRTHWFLSLALATVLLLGAWQHSQARPNSASVAIEPGSSLTVTCTTSLSVQAARDRKSATLICAPLGGVTATPTQAATATRVGPTPTEIVPTATRPAPTSTVPPNPTGAPPTATPIVGGVRFPIGPFHLEASGAMNNSYWTGGFMDLKRPNDLSILETVHAGGLRVLVHLTGGRSNFQNADGSFNLDMFKAQLDEWRGSELQKYVDNGTVIGHLMIDEPQDTNGNWGGHAFKYEDLEAAAAYSKSIWPNLPAGAGTSPVWLNSASFTWSAFDFASTPYTARKGDAQAFLNSQASAAQAEGLTLYMSINVLHGGNTPGSAVTADQLRSWGTLFINDPRNCGLTMWKWDNSDNGNFFSSPDVAGVLAELNALAATRGGCQ